MTNTAPRTRTIFTDSSRRITLISLLLFVIPISAHPFPSDSSHTPLYKPSVSIERTAGEITVDGNIDDPGWKDATSVTRFSEIEPGDNVEPRVDTRVLITYSESRLYVAFFCYDDPKKIRVSMRDRDEIFSDDFVAIILDTYSEASWAYELFSNPLGIQGDGRMTQENEDMNFDIIFQSAGRITDQGYQVELAIPFRSLRFPDGDQQQWRLTFFRNHPRDSRYIYSWAAVNRDNPCLLCQLGYVKGIEGISTGKTIELLPEMIASQSGGLKSADEPAGTDFEYGRVTAEASLGIKYNLTSDLTADVSINPDFSQVEADAAQIDVNTTFALSYPERRPFFQEGSDLFDTWMDLVYTRSVNDPSLAAKLTGRFRQTSVAYVGARDEHTLIILPFEEQSRYVGEKSRIRSLSNILRVKHNFREDSHIGLIATNRSLDGGGSGSVISMDINYRFLPNYRMVAQYALSRTLEPSDTTLTNEMAELRFGAQGYSAGFDGESYLGQATFLGVEREARTWNFELTYRSFDPTFRAANGFITQNNYQFLSGETEWVFWPQIDLIDQVVPGLDMGYEQNYSGLRKDQWVVPFLQVLLTKQTRVSIVYVLSQERFGGLDFPGIRRFEWDLDSDFSDLIKAGVGMNIGRSVARTEDPVLGHATQLYGWLSAKPLQQLTIEPELSYSKMLDPAREETIFRGYIFRARTSYQHNRRLNFRLLLQYDNFDQHVDADPLITYRLNAFSVLYLGATSDYSGVSASEQIRLDARQYFVKIRYLFQI